MPQRYDYKPFPLDKPVAATKQDSAWRPVLRVVIFSGHRRTPPIEAIVDTGADMTIFDADIARGMGLKVEQGDIYEFGGIAASAKVTGYIHKVKLLVAGDTIETPVVFADGIVSGGLLGQVGFFNHFIATFDWTPHPPCFEVQRISRN